MERQLDALKAWARENGAWAEIAYSAADARRIAAANKLVVILGVEAEYAFGAENRTFDPVARLRQYHDLGVRTFYLAHKINSRLAGADIYWPVNSSRGKAIRGTQAIAGCFYYDDNVGPFPLANKLGHNFCDNKCGKDYLKGDKPTDACASRFSEISEANMLDYLVARGDGTFNGFATYPLAPGFTGHEGRGGSRMDGDCTRRDSPTCVERNNLGLSHDGERVVREAMRKGMIVNIDHVSTVARGQMYDIASKDFGNYPLNALHNNPNNMLVGNDKLSTPQAHEYDFEDYELEYITKTNGFFGVRVGPFAAKEYPNSGVTASCAKTITETARILAYLMDKKLNVGYALDYATDTQGVWSRTFRNCGRELGKDWLEKYEDREVAEGLSHVGMMKYWHKELATVGLKPAYVDKVQNTGAEAFIAMWEQSEARSTLGKQIPRRTYPRSPRGNAGCSRDGECASGQYCRKPLGATGACTARKPLGDGCSASAQCASARCAWGVCAAPDECRAGSDCPRGQYCGDPVGGRASCKPLKARSQACTGGAQCATGRCAWGVCADPDECRASTDCASGQYCGDPVGGKAACKALKAHGQACTGGAQCATGRCAWGFCADPDECRTNGDCRTDQYCGDPVSGKSKCKALLDKGKACTRAIQCRSRRCTMLTCD